MNLKNILFFDIETTGLPDRNAKYDDFEKFPFVVSLSWIFNGVEHDYIIKPEGYEIPEQTTQIHGITTEYALKNGTPFRDVIVKFIADSINAQYIVAHNIYFDTSIVKANSIRYMGKDYYDLFVDSALNKDKRIDTMMKTIKFVGAKFQNGRSGKYPTLEELYDKLFPGETFNAHTSIDDVRALVRCFPKLSDLGLINVYVKSDENKTPIHNDEIEFKDSDVPILPENVSKGAEIIDRNKAQKIDNEDVKTINNLLDSDEF